jgi:hypothetical protein
MSGTMLRVNIFRIVHIGNVLEVEKLLSTLGVFVKRTEITYWPCYDSSLNSRVSIGSKTASETGMTYQNLAFAVLEPIHGALKGQSHEIFYPRFCPSINPTLVTD